jgi:hypothetical protein
MCVRIEHCCDNEDADRSSSPFMDDARGLVEFNFDFRLLIFTISGRNSDFLFVALSLFLLCVFESDKSDF